MPDLDYPYEDDPAGRKPEKFTPASDSASGYSPLSRFQQQRAASALDIAVIEQHQRWRTEGVDPDAPDAEDSIRIERNNARFAAEVETFAESWLLDSEIADIVLGNIDPSAFTPGPGL